MKAPLWCVADNDQNYPVHLAYKTDPVILTYLLRKGTNASLKNANGEAILHLAAASGNIEVANIILENFVIIDIPTTDPFRNTALHLAVKEDHFEMVKRLHEHGASLNIKNEYGSTPFHIAAFTGNATITDYLIKNGARVDATDKADKQPLHDAVYNNRFGVIKVLVAAGADVNALDGQGVGPLHIAAFNKKCPETMRYLIEHGADVDLKSRNKEETPVLVALLMGYIDGIKVLLEKGCDIDICSIDDSCVLHQSK